MLKINQKSSTIRDQETLPDQLRLALTAFLIDQQSQRHSSETIAWYRKRLVPFLKFLVGRGVDAPSAITPNLIRLFLLDLQDKDLADTTLHGYARAMRTFFKFLTGDGFLSSNPFTTVKMPKVGKKIMPALTAEEVKRMVAVAGIQRDKAVILCLLDTGARASEFVSLNVGDVNLSTGTVRINQGKGGKDRTCYLGATARKELIRYLRERPEVQPTSPLWLNVRTGERLTYWGLELLLRRVGEKAGVKNCYPHTFRRTFALFSLRAGMSIYHLQAIMGHADLTVLRQYLDLVEADAADAHKRFGAVDNML